MLFRPVTIAFKAVVFSNAVAVPLLRWMPSNDSRRLRLHHYLRLGEEDQRSVSVSGIPQGAQANFACGLEQRATHLSKQASQLLNDPKAAWWREHCTLLRIFPHKLVVMPLYLNLKVSASLDRLEARHPQIAYSAYLGSDLLACATLVYLSSGIVRDSIAAFMTTAPKPLVNRVAFIAGWATSGLGLTAITLHALWVRAINELSGLENPKPTPFEKGLRAASNGLLWSVRELPTLLGDSCLLFSFWHLGPLGRAFALFRAGYRLAPFVCALRGHSSPSQRESLSAAEMREPAPWHPLRESKIFFMLRPREEWDERLQDLKYMSDRADVSPALKREAAKLIDRYTLLLLAEAESTDTRNSERFKMLSEQAQLLLTHLNAAGYHEVSSAHPLGKWLAEHEESDDNDEKVVAQILKPLVLANPAQNYVYLREKGGIVNFLSAIAELPAMLFSVWTVNEETMPWGKPTDLMNDQGEADQTIYTKIQSLMHQG